MKTQSKIEPKVKILAVASAFGLGPVGKLSTIINASGNKYKWYATGPAFDVHIFGNNPFTEVCFSENENTIKNFVCRNNIKYAVVVLKNKIARLLKSLGLKVLYVDSLPFMWTQADFNSGKVPLNMDYYCAQRTLGLNREHLEMFNQVDNFNWVGPIVPEKFIKTKTKGLKPIVINIGGLHSPTGNDMSYVDIVVKSLINKLQKEYKNKIYITCGDKVKEDVETYLKNKNITVCTLTQDNFLNMVNNAFLFFTSPGLTTILEVSTLDVPINILPPQNLSQFYNVEHVPECYKDYKVLSWDDEILKLNYLRCLDKLEHEIVEEIYERFDYLRKDKLYMRKINKEIDKFIQDDYHSGSINKFSNGTKQILKLLNSMINEGEDNDN